MSTLSERIEKILTERPELGQSGLVDASGASKSVVNQWVDGKIKSMRLDYALKIEKKLGYDHIWLVLGEGFEMMAKPMHWPFTTSYESYNALPIEGKKAVDEHLEYTVHKWSDQAAMKSSKAS
jgi:hypothetical protein